MDKQIDFREYAKGQKDCANGVPHVEGRSESYTLGYSDAYEIEQQATAKGEQHESAY